MGIGGAISSFAISTAAISSVLQQQAQEEVVVVVVPAGGGDERKLDIIEAQAKPNSKKKLKKAKAAKPKKAKAKKPETAEAPDLPLLEYNLPKKRKKVPPKPKQSVLDAGEHLAPLPPLPPAPPKPAAWIGDVKPDYTPEGNLLYLPPEAPLAPAPVYGLTPALARMQADARDVHDAMAVMIFLAQEDLVPA